MRKAMSAGVSVLVLAAMGVSGAFAGEAVESKISIAVKGGDVKGKVKSIVPQCFEDRKVKVTYVSESGDKDVLGTTKTDSEGKYSVEGSGDAGTYKAKAKKAEVEVVGSPITCGAATATDEVG